MTRRAPFAKTLRLALSMALATALACPSLAFAADPTAATTVSPTETVTSSETTPVDPGDTSTPSEPDTSQSASSAPSQPAKKQLRITGLKTSFTKTPKSTIKDAVKISPAGKHQVLLQRYNPATGKWSTKAKFTTASNGKVTLKYPNTWRKTNSSTWRVAVKATSTTERLISKSVTITTKNRSSVKLKAKSAVIVNAATGQTYFTKNENTKRQNASTTKMMTALLAAERNELSDRVTITKQAANTDYSNLGQRSIGDTITVKNLLHMALIPSDNGAAEALAIHTAGSEKKFVSLMNKRAKELGCTNTSFKNPHGLTQKGHGSSAHDLALIAREVLNRNDLSSIVKKKSYSFRSTNGIPYTVKSTNKLLGSIKGIHGVKTGFTNAAGHCFVGAFKYKGNTYVTVVLGAPTSDARWSDTKKLIKYVKKWF
ncbi:D-alanyl-D-alanine carboxypeptidase family protein [uncultured Adlercreutzia sp.]|uniref:D-alanyl-D-alanine carboxypeptidase family protein n=1 Tax=uncultured Adlercreutzia sp. TaxID=875803 RepID=UPI00272EAE37|nr:D-alanyl-D-alanine carboxypeptidase family protein [uncultured Adlercreutzia sp.]MCI9262450.1 D-alanyl-D-alanine carboxypeptidase [Eggerthellaceae bacterium]